MKVAVTITLLTNPVLKARALIVVVSVIVIDPVNSSLVELGFVPLVVKRMDALGVALAIVITRLPVNGVPSGGSNTGAATCSRWTSNKVASVTELSIRPGANALALIVVVSCKRIGLI